MNTIVFRQELIQILRASLKEVELANNHTAALMAHFRRGDRTHVLLTRVLDECDLERAKAEEAP